MPMPASTFTLAVGHWHQVTAEIPQGLEESVSGRVDCSKATKLGAGPGELTENELVTDLGIATGDVVKSSPLQTGRYFIIFPMFFFLFQTVNPSLALMLSVVKFSFHRTENGEGEVMMMGDGEGVALNQIL